MADGCQMSKCRARYRLIAGKNSEIPGRKPRKGRYRFTPQVAIQDAEDRSIPFSIWTPRERARKRGVKGREGHCFVLLALLHLDDHSNPIGSYLQLGGSRLFSPNLLQMLTARTRDSRYY